MVEMWSVNTDRGDAGLGRSRRHCGIKHPRFVKRATVRGHTCVCVFGRRGPSASRSPALKEFWLAVMSVWRSSRQ